MAGPRLGVEEGVVRAPLGLRVLFRASGGRQTAHKK